MANKSMIISLKGPDRCRFIGIINRIFGTHIEESKSEPRTTLTRTDYDKAYGSMSSTWIWRQICEQHFGSTRDPLSKSEGFLNLMKKIYEFWGTGEFRD